MSITSHNLSIFWSLFWRSSVFLLPCFLGCLLVVGILLVTPFWSAAMFWEEQWLHGICGAAVWAMTLKWLGWVMQRTGFHFSDRYADGAV